MKSNFWVVVPDRPATCALLLPREPFIVTYQWASHAPGLTCINRFAVTLHDLGDGLLVEGIPPVRKQGRAGFSDRTRRFDNSQIMSRPKRPTLSETPQRGPRTTQQATQDLKSLVSPEQRLRSAASASWNSASATTDA
jgi:hypothetical protein